MHAIYCSPLAQSTLLAKYLIKVGKVNWKNAISIVYECSLLFFFVPKKIFLTPKRPLFPLETIGSLDSVT
jgi:hypothetical protein